MYPICTSVAGRKDTMNEDDDGTATLMGHSRRSSSLPGRNGAAVTSRGPLCARLATWETSFDPEVGMERERTF